MAAGVSLIEPLTACVPDHAPDAVHDVALVELHVIVVEPPTVMVEGVAAIVTVGNSTGFTVTVADPVILVYPGTVDAAVIVAVVIALIVDEQVNTPAAVIVPALAGLTDHVTAWLGLFVPFTVAANAERIPPAVHVAVVGLTVTEVTVVVV